MGDLREHLPRFRILILFGALLGTGVAAQICPQEVAVLRVPTNWDDNFGWAVGQDGDAIAIGAP